MRRALVVGIALSTACSTIGDPGGMPDAYPHGGTGQFRVLTGPEVGTANGNVIVLRNVAFDGSMVADGSLFYAAAPMLEEPPEVPMDHPEGEIYWPAFEPRSIYRAPPQDDLGYRSGESVLTAEASWEGSEVFDPWVVIDDEGRARLYYAAEGGIGVAEAANVDGELRRVGDGPILEGARRPSVVRGIDGAWWMYFDAGGAIGVARSEDGLAFERVDADPNTDAIDPIAITGEDLRDSPEVSVGMPGAVTVETPSGRRLVRLYFESRREDGTVLAYVAGSADGLAFERHELPVLASTDARFPAPVAIDARVTLLYVNLTAGGDYETRSLAVAVAPATVRFDAPDNDD